MRGQCKMEERASSHCGSGLLSVIISSCSGDTSGGKNRVVRDALEGRLRESSLLGSCRVNCSGCAF